MQYHWTCYQSLWNDVEFVTIRWFPSHHILHPANILENYQSMSSLPHFCRKKTLRQNNELCCWPYPLIRKPIPLPPSKERGTTFTHQPPPNHSHSPASKGPLPFNNLSCKSGVPSFALTTSLARCRSLGFDAPEISARFDRGLGRGKVLI